MKKKKETLLLAARIWFLSYVLFDAGLFICLFLFPVGISWIIIPAVFCAAVGSLPVLGMLFLLLPFIRRRATAFADHFIMVMLVNAGCALIYGVAGAMLFFLSVRNQQDAWLGVVKVLGGTGGLLFAISLISLL